MAKLKRVLNSCDVLIIICLTLKPIGISMSTHVKTALGADFTYVK